MTSYFIKTHKLEVATINIEYIPEFATLPSTCFKFLYSQFYDKIK